MKKNYKCIVNKIMYTEGISIVNVTTGVKRNEQWKYEEIYKSGYGTYCTGFENYPSELRARIYICELGRYCYLDIKENVLNINSRVRVTNKMVSRLNELNSGKRVYFEFEDGCIINDVNNVMKLEFKL